jgi:RNA polymerase sigma factor (TIGR02999 family)
MTGTMSLTGLLAAWSRGSLRARDEVFDVVYDELRRLAGVYLRRDGAQHSVPPTALVHEAYFKLVEQRQVRWQNRHHFFGIAAQAMRRILVDRARARQADRRGGARHDRPLRDVDAICELRDVDLLALDEALSRLAAIDPRVIRLVELHFFTGLTIRETATVLGVSPATVKRDWSIARAWLYRELTGCGLHRA